MGPNTSFPPGQTLDGWAFPQKPDPNKGFILVADDSSCPVSHFSFPPCVKWEFSWVPMNPVVCSFSLKGFKHMLALVLPSMAWALHLRSLLDNSPRGHHYPSPVALARERV